jgi:galactokinase
MRSPAAERSVRAFAPGRINVIGEHTDYNQGLALPFAIDRGVTVTAQALARGRRIEAVALDIGRRDTFAPSQPGVPASQAARGWRGFVRGAVGELTAAGIEVPPARLEITGTIPRGAGLASSAALSIGVTLALIDLSGASRPPALELARLCSRIENRWVGASTGLLDQLAALEARPGAALLIDFQTLKWCSVPMSLDGWQLVTVDSGERRALAGSGYNQRALECARARELLGVPSLRDADPARMASLPEPLRSRATHVVAENERVNRAVDALQSARMPELADLLNASHESLRDLFEISTATVERTRRALLAGGAAGARLLGGGFGGSLLALLPPGVPPPDGSVPARPADGARYLAV